jgi:hypothetical protein
MTATDRSRPVVIVGAGRSGTNVLREVLCSFPGFGTWPCDEINYIWRHGNRGAPTDELTLGDARPEVVRYVRGAFDRQQRRSGGDAVVEKTCATTLRVGFAHRIVPEARFVVIVRDGRDVTVSAMRRWTAGLGLRYLARKARFVPPADLAYYAQRYARARLARFGTADRRLSTWGPRFAGLDEAVRARPLAEVCALQWARCIETADRQLATIDPLSVHRLRYEDLVAAPEKEVARLAEFLQVATPDESALPIMNARSVGRWRTELAPTDQSAVETIGAEALATYGYARE